MYLCGQVSPPKSLHSLSVRRPVYKLFMFTLIRGFVWKSRYVSTGRRLTRASLVWPDLANQICDDIECMHGTAYVTIGLVVWSVDFWFASCFAMDGLSDASFHKRWQFVENCCHIASLPTVGWLLCGDVDVIVYFFERPIFFLIEIWSLFLQSSTN